MVGTKLDADGGGKHDKTLPSMNAETEIQK